MPWYRCTLESADKTVELTIDVLADAGGNVDRALMFFGYWRDLESSESQPFALNYDGKIDWGGSHVSTFPIRGTRIIAGATVLYTGYETSAAFDRGEVYYSNTFTVKKYINHAE